MKRSPSLAPAFALAALGALALAGSPARATLQPRTVFSEEFGFFT